MRRPDISWAWVLILTWISLTGLLGCGGSTLQAPPPTTTPIPDTQRILLLRSRLPAFVNYDVLGPLAVRKTSYGGPEWALERLAQAARVVGANAVVGVEVSFAPSWAGWATPHGKGTAVRILAPSLEELAAMPELKAEWC